MVMHGILPNTIVPIVRLLICKLEINTQVYTAYKLYSIGTNYVVNYTLGDCSYMNKGV